MSRIAIVVLAGCWSGAVSAPPKVEAPKLIIRMAEGDEYENAQQGQFGLEGWTRTCPVTGRTAMHLFRPIADYAIAHIVDRIDRFGLAPDSPIQTRYLEPNASRQCPPIGLSITIDPRSEVGRMTVQNYWGDGGHWIDVCLYVEHHGAQTVVVLKELVEMYGG